MCGGEGGEGREGEGGGETKKREGGREKVEFVFGKMAHLCLPQTCDTCGTKMGQSIDGWMNGWMDGWMDGWMGRGRRMEEMEEMVVFEGTHIKGCECMHNTSHAPCLQKTTTKQRLNRQTQTS